jgi:hypothetical protein
MRRVTTSDVPPGRPRFRWLRLLGALCALWIGYMIAGAATSGLVYGLDLQVSQSAVWWFSIGVGLLVAVAWMRSRWPTWQREDSDAAVGRFREVASPPQR